MFTLFHYLTAYCFHGNLLLLSFAHIWWLTWELTENCTSESQKLVKKIVYLILDSGHVVTNAAFTEIELIIYHHSDIFIYSKKSRITTNYLSPYL